MAEPEGVPVGEERTLGRRIADRMVPELLVSMQAALDANTLRLERLDRHVADLAGLVAALDADAADSTTRVALLDGTMATFVREAHQLREAFGMLHAVAQYGRAVPEHDDDEGGG